MLYTTVKSHVLLEISIKKFSGSFHETSTDFTAGYLAHLMGQKKIRVVFAKVNEFYISLKRKSRM